MLKNQNLLFSWFYSEPSELFFQLTVQPRHNGSMSVWALDIQAQTLSISMMLCRDMAEAQDQTGKLEVSRAQKLQICCQCWVVQRNRCYESKEYLIISPSPSQYGHLKPRLIDTFANWSFSRNGQGKFPYPLFPQNMRRNLQNYRIKIWLDLFAQANIPIKSWIIGFIAQMQQSNNCTI